MPVAVPVIVPEFVRVVKVELSSTTTPNAPPLVVVPVIVPVFVRVVKVPPSSTATPTPLVAAEPDKVP